MQGVADFYFAVTKGIFDFLFSSPKDTAKILKEGGNCLCL
jgi:hypothetical protein